MAPGAAAAAAAGGGGTAGNGPQKGKMPGGKPGNIPGATAEETEQLVPYNPVQICAYQRNLHSYTLGSEHDLTRVHFIKYHIMTYEGIWTSFSKLRAIFVTGLSFFFFCKTKICAI